MTQAVPPGLCQCCLPSGLGSGPGRRGLLGLAAGMLAAAMPGRPAAASDGREFDAMLLTCIDPRLVSPVYGWMEGQGLRDAYSQFAIAGAAVGVVAPRFAAWAPAFWDNLATSIELHRIKRVVVVNHRDCGAAKLAYGAAAIATPDAETALHRTVFDAFIGEMARRQPAMKVNAGLMALDGRIELFA